MIYFKQITKTINTSIENYNIINIKYDIDNINVYLNGLLLDNVHFIINNNNIIFDKDILKNGDYINIDFINKKKGQFIYNNIKKFSYIYDNNNVFNVDPFNGFANVYINGVLQNKDYEYIFEENIIKKIKINQELKNSDIIIIECIE